MCPRKEELAAADNKEVIVAALETMPTVSTESYSPPIPTTVGRQGNGPRSPSQDRTHRGRRTTTRPRSVGATAQRHERGPNGVAVRQGELDVPVQGGVATQQSRLVAVCLAARGCGLVHCVNGDSRRQGTRLDADGTSCYDILASLVGAKRR